MDSREPPRPPPPYSSAPVMMAGPTSYSQHPAAVMGPTTARFPFGSAPPPLSNPSEPFNGGTAGQYDGAASSAMKPCSGSGSGELAKKKRGRPRKYSPDGNIALGLAPTQASPSAAGYGGGGGGDSGGTPSTEAPAKKHRGRPPGSGKKQLDALGAGGIGFTPHVILVASGEDITAKIMAFCQQGPRTVCILSANGAVCNVTLRQPALSGGIATYEGRFEIVSLSGSMRLPENNGEHSRTGGLSVSLAGSDGRVLGGGVAGLLTAASSVQVIVGSFIANGKKSKLNVQKSVPSSAPVSSQLLTFGAPMSPASPTSQGPSSESSEDNDHSHFSGRGPGLYNNASQPVHNMQQMYHQPLWAGQTHQ